MKIRTDFVTNSSSSSFCVVTVSLNDGTTIDWMGEDGDSPVFMVPSKAKQMVQEIQSVEDLAAFLVACGTKYNNTPEDLAFHQDFCSTFYQRIQAVPDLQAVKTLHISWGEYQTDCGEAPWEGCDGEQLDFNFETKKCTVKRTPDKDFVQEMIDIYGDLFDQDME